MPEDNFTEYNHIYVDFAATPQSAAEVIAARLATHNLQWSGQARDFALHSRIPKQGNDSGTLCNKPGGPDTIVLVFTPQ